MKSFSRSTGVTLVCQSLAAFSFATMSVAVSNAAELVVLTSQGAIPGVRELGAAFARATGHKVTYFKDANVDDGKHRGIVLSVITRLEEQTVKSLIQNVDPKAFIVTSNAHEVLGKNYSD